MRRGGWPSTSTRRPALMRKPTEQTVAHGAAGRAGFEIKVVRRGPVNGAVMRLLSGLDGVFAVGTWWSGFW